MFIFFTKTSFSVLEVYQLARLNLFEDLIQYCRTTVFTYFWVECWTTLDSAKRGISSWNVIAIFEKINISMAEVRGKGDREVGEVGSGRGEGWGGGGRGEEAPQFWLKMLEMSTSSVL